MAKKIGLVQRKPKLIKFSKDAIVCLRGYLLPDDKKGKKDRFVAFLRNADTITVKDLHKRRKPFVKNAKTKI